MNSTFFLLRFFRAESYFRWPRLAAVSIWDAKWLFQDVLWKEAARDSQSSRGLQAAASRCTMPLLSCLRNISDQHTSLDSCTRTPSHSSEFTPSSNLSIKPSSEEVTWRTEEVFDEFGVKERRKTASDKFSGGSIRLIWFLISRVDCVSS